MNTKIEWETLAETKFERAGLILLETTKRIKTPGGWVVGITNGVVKNGGWSSNVTTDTSLVYVPDPEHEWTPVVLDNY